MNLKKQTPLNILQRISRHKPQRNEQTDLLKYETVPSITSTYQLLNHVNVHQVTVIVHRMHKPSFSIKHKNHHKSNVTYFSIFTMHALQKQYLKNTHSIPSLTDRNRHLHIFPFCSMNTLYYMSLMAIAEA